MHILMYYLRACVCFMLVHDVNVNYTTVICDVYICICNNIVYICILTNLALLYLCYKMLHCYRYFVCYILMI